MNGFQWFLKSIGIDLSPDGIKEMFSKVSADDIRRLVGELGLNPDEILALPKIVAAKLQQFEMTQNRILQLLEQQHAERYSGKLDEQHAYYASNLLARGDQGGAGHSSSIGNGTDCIDNGIGDPA